MQTCQIGLSIENEVEFQKTVKTDPGIQEWNFGGLENLDCSNLTIFEHIHLVEFFMQGKITRDDIEHISQIEKRLFKS